MRVFYFIAAVFVATNLMGQTPKNVIVIIGDGLGFNHSRATEIYNGSSASYSQFPVQTAVYTLPAMGQKVTEPKNLDRFNSHYHSTEAWGELEYLDSASIDYASAGTALATGMPTGTGCFGYSIDSVALENTLSLVKNAGKSFGIITNTSLVQSASSAFFAQTLDANDKAKIGADFLASGVDLLLAGTSPEYDSLGNLNSSPDYSSWGGQTNWDDLQSGDFNVIDIADSKADFQSQTLDKPLIGLSRYADFGASADSSIFPSLSREGLDLLNQNSTGFMAVIESRQIEYLSRANSKEALITEMNRFNSVVDSTIAWVEENSSWEETALIVVGLYESGMLADTTFDRADVNIVALSQLKSEVVGEYNFSLNSSENTNALTPLFAKGVGTEIILDYADHTDFYRGGYVSLPEVGRAIKGFFPQLTMPKPKNIILMIADGAGENQLKAGEYYFGYTPSYKSFPVKYFMSTYPARNGYNNSLGACRLSYSSDRAWGVKDFLFGYNNVTCSASSALAMGSGKKSYYYGMGLDVDLNAMSTIAQYAKQLGKSAGIVSTMSFNNATPASFAAHDISRKSYTNIGKELLIESKLDVIIGCGHPEYTNDNELSEKPAYGAFGGKENWDALLVGETVYPVASKSGWTEVQDIDGDGTPDPWTVLSDISEFENVVNGAEIKRLFGLPKVAETLQQKRAGNVQSVNMNNMNNVPDLSLLSKTGLEVLNKNSNGFFAMLEGGAIDQAGHENQKGRLIEESLDFNKAVDTVIAWIERNGGWDENLLIITADHETGLLTREKIADDTIWPRYAIKDNGAGNMPGMYFHHEDHSNQLVPFYAKGAGSDIFSDYADEYDFYRGRYLTNSEIGEAMYKLWGGTPGVVVNRKPIVIGIIEKQTGIVGVPFSYIIPQAPFQDSDDDADFRFEVIIPSVYDDWMQFDNKTGEISGIPTTKKNASVTVIAYDGATTGSAIRVEVLFLLSIQQGAVTGVQEKGETTVFPNPVASSQYLHIEENVDLLGIRLVGDGGTVVFENKQPSKSNKIEVSSLPKGQYVLVLQMADRTEVQKIIVE